MSDTSIQVTDEMAEKFADAKGISISEARERLAENFRQEAEKVDVRQMYVKLIKAYREMAPKVEGVVMRETDLNNKITVLQHELISTKSQLAAMDEKLELFKDTFNKSLSVLNDIIKEDSNTMARIKALETPFYKRIWNKIKCLLKI